jgi:hypothetical protein
MLRSWRRATARPAEARSLHGRRSVRVEADPPQRAMQDSNLRLPEGSARLQNRRRRCRRAAAVRLPVRDRSGRNERGQSAPGRERVQLARRCPELIDRLRFRQVLAVAVMLLPLILAACNKGGSSGY